LPFFSFWFQATVTEERLVPALNVIANHFQIPDHVAGATLMAAGGSSPELFAATVSLFVTHSAMGIGTIVGSEIFNQLLICAGCIFAARKNTLVLDPVIVIRDVSFYAVSLMLLLLALSDTRDVDGDDDEHVYISFFHSSLLVGCYVVYVLVCSNWDRVLHLLKFDSGNEVSDSYRANDFKTFQVQDEHIKEASSLPFVRSVLYEPSLNFNHSMVEPARTLEAQPSTLTELRSASLTDAEEGNTNCLRSKPEEFFLDEFEPKYKQLRWIECMQRESNGNLSLFLWVRSSFYNKMRIGVNAWQLRWFTFNGREISSQPGFKPNKTKNMNLRRGLGKGSTSFVPKEDVEDTEKKGMVVYPSFNSFEVDEAHLLLKINSSRRDYIFMAPTEEILNATTRRFEEILRCNSTLNENEKGEEVFDETECHSSLIAYPHGGSKAQRFSHVLLFPLKALIHFGVPDVRGHTSNTLLGKAFLCVFLSTCFLIVGSFVMVTTLEGIAHRLYIPETIIGATISAAGTSLPNYIASQIAARQGLGNMAISNIFGSNTFNILVGLGLPWLLYTGIYGSEYSDLRDEGITESMVTLIVALVVFICIITFSRFELRLWHAYLFSGMYALFLLHYLGRYLVDDFERAFGMD